MNYQLKELVKYLIDSLKRLKLDKNKSDKLKEILSQTISQEEIEEKLKQEIKTASEKKAEHKSQKKENIKIEIKEEALPYNDTTKEKEQTSNKEVIIPSIRNKKKENRDINTLLYLVGIIALLLFLVVIYLFINKDNLSKSNLVTNNKEITTEKFYKEKIKKDTENIVSINNDKVVKEPIIKEVKPKEIIKEIIKEKIVTKIVKLDKKNFKTYYNSSKYNSLKCYNFKAGNIFPTSLCKNNLAKFLKDNKNAIRFEVIPVISKSDNIVFNKMQSNLKNMDKTFQNRVKEYMYRGLSRERVLETTWYIKDILGVDTILTPTNYYVKSKKNNKGIIVKAYH